MIGRTISHYKITDKLGEGGMGVVYKAEDTQLQRTVALKFLPRHVLGGENERARFLQEARAAAALDHPNICTIYEIAAEGEDHFIVMAYVEGENLEERIAKGPMPLVDAVTVSLQLANALHEAHSKGVVHRDIKPSNVIISDKGHAILMDFGLAKLHGQTRLTQEGTTLGTVAYMSPEQAQGGDVDQRSDIWSLGVMLYEMITGRQPFTGEHQAAVIFGITNNVQPPLTSLRSDVPMELERIVNKMLAKNPEERYPSVDDVRVDLKAMRKFLRGETDSTATVLTPQPGAGPMPASGAVPAGSAPPGKIVGETSSGTLIVQHKRPPWVIPVLAVAAVAVAVALFLTLRDGGGGGTTDRQTASDASVIPLENSLAVLPLRNISGDEKNEFFVDGMTEELITQLAGIRSLKVISRTSIMRYKNTDKPLTEIARELDVGRVLEGSVLWAGDQVRISVQLIDGTDDAHLWANSYESDLSDVLGLQRRVARAVADEIQLELTPQEAAELAETPTVDARSHELYLQGRHHWYRRTPESIAKSIEYFEQAIAQDPTNARAYAGLAQGWIVRPAWDENVPTSVAYPNAREAALKAIELDPSLSGAYAVLGGVAQEYDMDAVEAERQLRKAIEMNPGNATAHQWYAEQLVGMGRFDEAVREIETTLELDPLSLIAYVVAIWIHAAAGNDTRSLELADKALELDPNYSAIYGSLNAAYLMMGQERKSCEAWVKFLRMTAENDNDRAGVRMLEEALENEGIEAFWRASIELRKQQRRESYMPPAQIAGDFAALGEVDSAIVWLEKGVAEPTLFNTRIPMDPRFNPIRSDPRYRRIIGELGLEDADRRYQARRAERPSS